MIRTLTKIAKNKRTFSTAAVSA
jgi:presequence protease